MAQEHGEMAHLIRPDVPAWRSDGGVDSGDTLATILPFAQTRRRRQLMARYVLARGPFLGRLFAAQRRFEAASAAFSLAESEQMQDARRLGMVDILGEMDACEADLAEFDAAYTSEHWRSDSMTSPQPPSAS